MTEWTGSSTTSATEDFQVHDNADNEHFRSGNSAKLTSNTSTTVYDNSTDTEGKTVSHTFWVYGNSGETFTTEDFTIVYDGGTQTNTETTTHTLSLTGWNVVIHEYAVPDNVTSYQFKISANSTTIWVDDYEANINDYIVSSAELDVLSFTDYYAFGMAMEGRTHQNDEYRYGYNGKEKDNEVKGSGVMYDYGFRVYDARLGRFLSVDPLAPNYPWYTPYQFAGNKPIHCIDLDGLEEQYHGLIWTEVTTVELQGGVTSEYIGPDDGDWNDPKNWRVVQTDLKEVQVTEMIGTIDPNWKPQYAVSNSPFESDVDVTGGAAIPQEMQDYWLDEGRNAAAERFKKKVGINSVEVEHDYQDLLNQYDSYLVLAYRDYGYEVFERERLIEIFTGIATAYRVGGSRGTAGNGGSSSKSKGTGGTGSNNNTKSSINNGRCFIAGTFIKTENGSLPIEKVEIGDLVWSFNLESDSLELKTVIKTFIHEDVKELIKIESCTGEIFTTPEHPFYSNGSWVKAKDLKTGDSLRKFDNEETCLIENISYIDSLVNVYNFEVEDNHNYFVTEEGVLVHNKGFQTKPIPKAKSSNGNVSTGEGRDHVTYTGIKNGKPYVGYASAPSNKKLSDQGIINYRYNGDYSKFGGVPPTPVPGSRGTGIPGKQKSRGLEQKIYQENVNKYGKSGVANRQNPVGANNKNKNNYMKAAGTKYYKK